MAGARQHYIPRFLQKGFSSKETKKSVYTFVYKRNKPVFESNIINIGVEGYFYGQPEEYSIDEEITRRERIYEPVISQLRNHNVSEYLNFAEIPEIVAAFSLRNKNTRDMIFRTCSVIASEMLDNISSEEVLANIMTKHINNKPELIEVMLRDEIKKRHLIYLPDSSKKSFVNKAFEMLPDLIKSNSTASYQQFRFALLHILSSSLTISITSHLKLLSDPDASFKERLKQLANFRWSLVAPKYEKYILGDVGPWVVTDEAEKLPFALSTPEISRVYFPISSDRMLVGINEKYSAEVNVNIVNLYAASLCSDFFISSEKNETLVKLQEIMGVNLSVYMHKKAKEFQASLLERL